jgi:hypothetical protein
MNFLSIILVISYFFLLLALTTISMIILSMDSSLINWLNVIVIGTLASYSIIPLLNKIKNLNNQTNE